MFEGGWRGAESLRDMLATGWKERLKERQGGGSSTDQGLLAVCQLSRVLLAPGSVSLTCRCALHVLAEAVIAAAVAAAATVAGALR